MTPNALELLTLEEACSDVIFLEQRDVGLHHELPIFHGQGKGTFQCSQFAVDFCVRGACLLAHSDKPSNVGGRDRTGAQGYWQWILDYLTNRSQHELNDVALAYTYLDKDRALEWLEKS